MHTKITDFLFRVFFVFILFFSTIVSAHKPISNHSTPLACVKVLKGSSLRVRKAPPPLIHALKDRKKVSDDSRLQPLSERVFEDGSETVAYDSAQTTTQQVASEMDNVSGAAGRVGTLLQPILGADGNKLRSLVEVWNQQGKVGLASWGASFDSVLQKTVHFIKQIRAIRRFLDRRKNPTDEELFVLLKEIDESLLPFLEGTPMKNTDLVWQMLSKMIDEEGLLRHESRLYKWVDDGEQPIYVRLGGIGSGVRWSSKPQIRLVEKKYKVQEGPSQKKAKKYKVPVIEIKGAFPKNKKDFAKFLQALSTALFKLKEEPVYLRAKAFTGENSLFGSLPHSSYFDFSLRAQRELHQARMENYFLRFLSSLIDGGSSGSRGLWNHHLLALSDIFFYPSRAFMGAHSPMRQLKPSSSEYRRFVADYHRFLNNGKTRDQRNFQTALIEKTMEGELNPGVLKSIRYLSLETLDEIATILSKENIGQRERWQVKEIIERGLLEMVNKALDASFSHINPALAKVGDLSVFLQETFASMKVDFDSVNEKRMKTEKPEAIALVKAPQPQRSSSTAKPSALRIPKRLPFDELPAAMREQDANYHFDYYRGYSESAQQIWDAAAITGVWAASNLLKPVTMIALASSPAVFIAMGGPAGLFWYFFDREKLRNQMENISMLAQDIEALEALDAVEITALEAKQFWEGRCLRLKAEVDQNAVASLAKVALAHAQRERDRWAQKDPKEVSFSLNTEKIDENKDKPEAMTLYDSHLASFTLLYALYKQKLQQASETEDYVSRGLYSKMAAYYLGQLDLVASSIEFASFTDMSQKTVGMHMVGFNMEKTHRTGKSMKNVGKFSPGLQLQSGITVFKARDLETKKLSYKFGTFVFPSLMGSLELSMQSREGANNMGGVLYYLDMRQDVGEEDNDVGHYSGFYFKPGLEGNIGSKYAGVDFMLKLDPEDYDYSLAGHVAHAGEVNNGRIFEFKPLVFGNLQVGSADKVKRKFFSWLPKKGEGSSFWEKTVQKEIDRFNEESNSSNESRP